MSNTVRFISGVVIAGVGLILSPLGGGGLMWIGAGIALSAASNWLTPEPNLSAAAWDRSQTVAGGRTPVPVGYGRVKLGGHVAYAQTSGANSVLWMVLDLCHGEIEDIDEIYLDGNLAVLPDGTLRSREGAAQALGGSAVTAGDPTLIAFTGHNLYDDDTVEIKSATPAAVNGIWSVKRVDANTFSIPIVTTSGGGNGTVKRLTPGYTGKVGFAKYLGTDTQNTTAAPGAADGPTADSTLSASAITAVLPEWTAAARGRGIAYLVLALTMDSPDNESLFAGVPDVQCIVRGRKVKDPRTGATAYSTNPALCIRDYLTSARYGGGAVGIVEADVFDGASNAEGLRAEAQYADEMVDVPANAGMVAITSSDPSNDRFTTGAAHGRSVGNSVWIRGHSGSVPAVSGKYTIATVPTSTTFTLTGVDLTTGGTGGTVQNLTTQKRFECNGTVDTGAGLKANLEALLTACRGQLHYEAGQYHLFTRRAVTAETFELDEAVIVGDWSFTAPGAAERPNTVVCTFVNPKRAWQAESFRWPLPGMTNSYLTDDNGYRVERSIDLPYTTSRFMAEQIAMVALEEWRQGLIVELTAKEEALKLAVGSVVNVSHRTPGWGPTEAAPSAAKKKFWVMGLGLAPGGLVRPALMEYVATAYDMQMTDDEDTPRDTALPSPWVVEAPLNLLAFSQSRDPRIRVQWDASPDAYLDRYEVQAKRTAPAAIADSEFRSYGSTNAEERITSIPVTQHGEQWTIQVRAVNLLGRASAWVSVNHTVSLSPAAQFSVVATAQSGSVEYAVTFGDNCHYVELFTIENAGTGGPAPAETSEYSAGYVSLKDGATVTKVIGGMASQWK